jgi:class 3 adenylate cyclase
MRLAAEPSSTETYNRLAQESSEAAKAVAAEIHSVSVPVPPHSPTHLRIIYSSEPEPAKVVGREFPLTKGIASWVFLQKQPYYVKEVGADSRHFDLVDRAAGTRTGEGAMLALPLVAGDRSYGVVQFMKSAGGRFGEEDVQTAARWSPALTRLLIELERSPKQDIPSVARGNVVMGSILFSDIREFTAVGEALRLENLVALLNEYYSRLVPIAISRGGKLLEYVGDGLYITFLLDSPSSSARAAVESAVAMQSEYDRVLSGWLSYHQPVSRANAHSIGIASGPVYSGLVGPTSERREKIIGPAINCAAHLCEAAHQMGGCILICHETNDLIRGENLRTEPTTTPFLPSSYRVIPDVARGSATSDAS